MKLAFECEQAFVAISDINVDPKYQREVSMGRVRRNVRNFHPGAVKAVSLSRRADGSLWATDGHHTIKTLLALGATHVPALIVAGDAKSEADSFTFINGKGSIKARPHEIHKAALEAGQQEAHEAQALLNSYGISIADRNAAGVTRALSSIKGWMKSDKPRLVRAMDMLDRIWCNEAETWEQIVIRGAFEVAGTDKLQAVERGLIKHKVTPRRILDAASAMQSATGTIGGGSAWVKRAYFQLAKVEA